MMTICNVPYEFSKILQNQKEISDSEFEMIHSIIEGIWGYKIIKSEYPLFIYSDYSISEDTYQSQRRKTLSGILTFDLKLNRFVIFKFQSDLDTKNLENGLIGFKSLFLNNSKSDTLPQLKHIDFKKSYIKYLKRSEINIELTKVITIFSEHSSIDLSKCLISPNYFDCFVEFWKLTTLKKNNYYIEKIKNDFNEEKIDLYNEISELNLLNLSNQNSKTSKLYFIFKEYLRFYFPGKYELSVVEIENEVERFIENSFGDYEQTLDDLYDRKHVIIPGITNLQSYLNHFVEYYNNKFMKGGREKLEYQNLSTFLKIILKTDFKNDNTHKIQFHFKFKLEEIFINVTHYHYKYMKDWDNNLLDFKINTSTTTQDISKFMSKIHDIITSVYPPLISKHEELPPMINGDLPF
jgi:hypothetical protein